MTSSQKRPPGRAASPCSITLYQEANAQRTRQFSLDEFHLSPPSLAGDFAGFFYGMRLLARHW